jgi:hypothetical protein
MTHVESNQSFGDSAAIAAMTDERLMLVFPLGNSAAFTELFRRYSNPIYGFFQRRLENPARAEELAQETFVAVLRGIERYEPRATFRSYLSFVDRQGNGRCPQRTRGDRQASRWIFRHIEYCKTV